MAKWNKNKVSSDLINNGNEFTSGDNLAVNELNAIVNNSFYASEKAENAEKLAESAVKGNGTLVTINGQIQGEWSADFAEAERQKSKNLFYFSGKGTKNRVGVDFAWNDTQQTITVNGTPTENYNSKLDIKFNPITLKAGEVYSIILNTVSSRDVAIRLLNDDQNKEISIRTNKKFKRVTFSEDVVLTTAYLNFYTGNSYNESFKICICEGIDELYQDWNGAIVHEKEIAGVEHFETIYDRSNKNVIEGIAYTNGLQADIGESVYNLGLTKNNFKSVIIEGNLDSIITSTRIDLSNIETAGSLISSNIRDNRYGISSITFRISTDGTFTVLYASYITPSEQYDKNNNGSYIITNIKGVK